MRDRTEESVGGLWDRLDSVGNHSIIARRAEAVEVIGEHFAWIDAYNNRAQITIRMPLRAAVDGGLSAAVRAFRHFCFFSFFKISGDFFPYLIL